MVEAFTKRVKDKKDIMSTVMLSNYVVLAAALVIILFVKKDTKE